MKTPLGTVTEVFITRVKPGKYENYRDWASKIQEIEKTFPGYKGTYLQAPAVNDRDAWVTILHFDNFENLDNWLNSKERQEIISESKNFVENLDIHRLNTPFPGWFPADSSNPKQISVMIKETMLILLVLFPIVMLEIKFLNPHLKNLNPSLGTFIGNAISVSLITWPMMPLCLYFLKWWLYTKSPARNILGCSIVFTLYLTLIVLFS
jgi:hypothetical protein